MPIELVDSVALSAEQPASLGRFGRFEVVRKIADGGMATVYLAQMQGDHRFTKWSALKVIRSNLAKDERFARMFLAEARLVARIDHPNVCSVFDFGEVDGVQYLAMEYLAGQPLHHVLRAAATEARGVPLQHAARIIADAAMGLHAAHELKTEDGVDAGVVHRDVSPHNVFVLYSGATKVMDFGVALSVDRGDEELTQVDELKGKLAYMPPEQLNREPLDRRSDVFSLGVVLWELTTGRRLFKRKSEGQTVVAILTEEIPPPSSVVSDYPAALERVVMRALERDPSKRYKTAAALAVALDAFIASYGRPTGQPHVSAFMHELFTGAIDEEATRLRKAKEVLRAGVSGPFAAIDSGSFKRPSLTPSGTRAHDPEGATQTGVLAAKQPAPKRPTWVLAAAGVAAVGLLLGVGWVAGSGALGPATRAATTEATPRATQPAQGDRAPEARVATAPTAVEAAPAETAALDPTDTPVPVAVAAQDVPGVAEGAPSEPQARRMRRVEGRAAPSAPNEPAPTGEAPAQETEPTTARRAPQKEPAGATPTPMTEFE